MFGVWIPEVGSSAFSRPSLNLHQSSSMMTLDTDNVQLGQEMLQESPAQRIAWA